MAELLDAPPGLKGVVAAETRIGGVRGEEGFYHYRQYDAIELARKRTLEEVWCLLLDGELPGPGHLAAFVARAAQARPVSPSVTAALPVIAALATGAQPLHGLRAAYELVVLHQRLPS
jgi:citrate synthase